MQCWQALDLPYEILSASDTNAAFRQFFEANHAPDTFKHVFTSVEDQIEGRGCTKCTTSASTTATGRCHPTNGKTPMLFMAGSPCDPFSTQRCKRFQTGQVMQHSLAGVTMNTVTSLFARFEPRVGILEQVQGFVMPLTAGATETPCDRPGLSSPCEASAHSPINVQSYLAVPVLYQG